MLINDALKEFIFARTTIRIELGQALRTNNYNLITSLINMS
ncbi:hypothetical protein [Clostridium estertheticum]|nr:hypothetical protein [Clostridium estertheticum]